MPIDPRLFRALETIENELDAPLTLSATIMGLEGTFEPLSDSIGSLWHDLIQRRSELAAHPVGQRDFGLCRGAGDDTDNIRYTAGQELLGEAVAQPPFAVREIPAGWYAVFTHRGPSSTGRGSAATVRTAS